MENWRGGWRDIGRKGQTEVSAQVTTRIMNGMRASEPVLVIYGLRTVGWIRSVIIPG